MLSWGWQEERWHTVQEGLRRTLESSKKEDNPQVTGEIMSKTSSL